MKICFHVDELERWGTCLANVYNTLNYFKENNVDGAVEVIVNAAAVKSLSAEGAKNAGIAEELLSYIHEGVVVKACANALKGNDIAVEALLEGVTVVPAGIIELANKQAEGFAYIRP